MVAYAAQTQAEALDRSDMYHCRAGDHSEHGASGEILVVYAWRLPDRYRPVFYAVLNVYSASHAHIL